MVSDADAETTDAGTPYSPERWDPTATPRRAGGSSGAVRPRRLFWRRAADADAGRATRLGSLRRPSLVAVAVLLTMAVPLAVVRLASDDGGAGESVGGTLRRASAHVLHDWAPSGLAGLAGGVPSMPALPGLAALTDRSVGTAAVAATGDAADGAPPPSKAPVAPPPPPPPAPPSPPSGVLPADAAGRAWPSDTGGEGEEGDPPADGVVSLVSLLTARFGNLLGPPLLRRAPWLFPPAPSCVGPSLRLRVDDEEHPLPGSLRLLRPCGPDAGPACEPDLSAHIPDLRRVFLALPLPADPPGLLTVYPSGRPGVVDEGEAGVEEAAGEAASVVQWRLEDDAVVVRRGRLGAARRRRPPPAAAAVPPGAPPPPPLPASGGAAAVPAAAPAAVPLPPGGAAVSPPGGDRRGGAAPPPVAVAVPLAGGRPAVAPLSAVPGVTGAPAAAPAAPAAPAAAAAAPPTVASVVTQARHEAGVGVVAAAQAATEARGRGAEGPRRRP
ncbi:hypothetical protein BU14_0207s0010 [Porphyra umbilicalis]|uniref:Uncharacterized protein n=1 Tax=Porphyra umbilicalis TaxID=2786 RepID=A0A1X6P5S2_PORUM|nr:hypothetical protein BU14_0207s0010 [Porphyra umbilicalis]|eukprot:OSX76090.1 hypothetical protein BU14_0207s0010 [Porphyra umbilicalis]